LMRQQGRQMVRRAERHGAICDCHDTIRTRLSRTRRLSLPLRKLATSVIRIVRVPWRQLESQVPHGETLPMQRRRSSECFVSSSGDRLTGGRVSGS
jgi:hypothetical protein